MTGFSCRRREESMARAQNPHMWESVCVGVGGYSILTGVLGYRVEASTL